MNENPYQATVGVAPSNQRMFHPTTGLAGWVARFLVLIAITSVVSGVMRLGFSIVNSNALSPTFWSISIAMTLGIVAMTFVGYTGCVVLFLVWVYRVTANGRALGGSALPSPSWAVVYWFIPILNLALPIQTLRQVYRVSYARGASDPAVVELPSFFGAWWTCFLLSILFWRLSDLPLSEVGSTITTVAAAYFAIQVVRETSYEQDRHFRSLSDTGAPSSPFSTNETQEGDGETNPFSMSESTPLKFRN